ncbi:polyketide synthase [Alternaria alternata]|nr:polyketide synthase [Alternaria alternata]
MTPLREPIAVIGSACRFPGGANSPHKLWELLRDPRDILREFPDDRLVLSKFYNGNANHHGSTNVRNRSYLLSEDIRAFDAPFFHINPREADGMDPAQRILLEAVYEALEAAGYTMEQMQGTHTSVFVGVMNSDWWDLQMRDTETIATHAATGTARSIVSNRISYVFDLKGVSMTIDTACSSSLVALHQAVQSLRSGESTAAIVGGANILLDPAMYIAESTLQMLSPESRSRMWDKSANGYARGEGCAAVFLKPLTRAIADGDHIECVIRETGVSSDGRTQGITMPSAAAQAALIKSTYRSAGLDPLADRCQYFECHGTGTPAGDPIEAQAIAEAFFSHSGEDAEIYVGSIKTVIGHLEGCAGLAGLLKASLAIQNRTIPANMLFNDLNPLIGPYYRNLKILQAAKPWPQDIHGPRRASVNSFGFGGTNAHVILESYEPEMQGTHVLQERSFHGPLTFSACSKSSLLATISNFTSYIKTNPAIDLQNLAWVLQRKRTEFPVKQHFSGSTHARLIESMEAYLQNAGSSGLNNTTIDTKLLYPSEIPRVLGIFTGQGAQWATMGKEFIQNSYLFRESIDRSEAALVALPDPPSWSLISELFATVETSRLNEAELSQPLCTAIQIAIVDLMFAAGVKLDAVVGHSSGEIAAAYASGIISAADAMAIAYYRGFHAKRSHGTGGKRGGMVAAELSYEAALQFCEKVEWAGRLVLAASNSPSSITLSGDLDAVQEAHAYFEKENIFSRLLRVDTAYHSHHMIPCAEPYLTSLKACNIQVSQARSDCIWISSVSGDVQSSSEEQGALTGEYWVDNMVKPVLFSQAVQCSIWNSGPFESIVEIGPHFALKGPTTQVMEAVLESSPPYLSFMRRGHGIETFSDGLGRLWSKLGPSSVDLTGYWKACSSSHIKFQMLKGLPAYAWDHDKVYWKEGRISRNHRLRKDVPHELLGRRTADDSDYELRWRNVLRLTEIPWIRGHKFQGQVLFPAAGYVTMALEASKALVGDRHVRLFELRDICIRKALVLEEDQSSLETVFSVKRLNADFGIHDENMDLLEAEFSCYVCADETVGTLEKTVSGRIIIHLGSGVDVKLPPAAHVCTDLSPVDLDRFYSTVEELGLSYQGLFKGLDHAERMLNHSHALAVWENHSMGAGSMVHPALLDVMFQAIFVASISPAAPSTLWTPYLPVSIDRIIVDPDHIPVYSHPEVRAHIQAYVTKSSASSIVGDIHLLDSNGIHNGIQVEGLSLKSVAEPTEENDRSIFSQTVWDTDIASGTDFLRDRKEDAQESKLIHAIERVALFHFRSLVEAITVEKAKTLAWHHQLFLKAVKANIETIRTGGNPVVRQEWLYDTRETIEDLRAQHPGQIDLNLMHAVSEKLISIVCGETQILEVMLQDDMLNDFYMRGRGFETMNNCIARAVQQIAHKHPRAKYLEIGAGTGGTTHRILDTIESAYTSYEYTDISSAFFEKASHKFDKHASKMVFKVLDIEKDVVDQGFENGAYDVVIAANVLHATRTLSGTMGHIRSLLKPGGYLIFMEVTGDQLRLLFLFGALPGWWLGAGEGRSLGPGVSTIAWDNILRNTGFSGVDDVFYDFPDRSRHTCSVMISQAVDDQLRLLRDPLAATGMPISEQVLIIGGDTSSVSQLAYDTKRLISPWASCVAINNIDGLDSRRLPSRFSVICLTELDKPLFSEIMSEQRLSNLQNLFATANVVFWITSGCNEGIPVANMMVGIGRALATELPHLTLQFLDVKTVERLKPSIVAQSFFRLVLAKPLVMAEKSMLWTTEPELVFDGDDILIPRVLPDKEMNNRFNAARRPISENLWKESTCIELSNADNSSAPALFEIKNTIRPGETTIDVKYSVCLGKRCTFVLGVVSGTSDTVLAISDTNASSVRISKEHVFFLPHDFSGNSATLLLDTANHVLAAKLLRCISPNSIALIYEPGVRLAAAIRHHAHENTVDVFPATSNREKCGEGWAFIHPHATERDIRTIIPRNTGCFINLSFKPPGALSRALLQQTIIHGPDCLSQIVSSADGFLLEAAFNWATTGLLSLDSVETVSVQSYVGTTRPSRDFPLVFDWTAPRLPVTVKPLEPKGLFLPDKTYLMIGMTGDLGRSLCRWMAEHGARYVVLTSRNAEVDSAWIESMAAIGATVKVYKMDVSNRKSVLGVYTTIKNSLPTIAGVCNAAMVLEDRLFANMTVGALSKVFEPKVEGSKVLDEIFHELNLDFFILFSSLTSILGNGGQSNYHAANLFMTSMCAQRRARGLAASVMHIGMVADIGYVARSDRHIENHLRKLQYHPMSETDMHYLFAEAVMSSRADHPGNWNIVSGIETFVDAPGVKLRPPHYHNPRFAHYVREENARKEDLRTDKTERSVKELLEDAISEEDVTTVFQQAFLIKLERLTQLESHRIDANKSLLNLGVDSLSAVEIRNWFLQTVGVDIPVLKLLRGDTVSEISIDATKKYLAQRTS